jgi:hypothetical protein
VSAQDARERTRAGTLAPGRSLLPAMPAEHGLLLYCHQAVIEAETKKARSHFCSGPSLFAVLVVGRTGVEPVTNGLKVRCSTN